ncbi:GntR family transcriptional regulator [Vibrio sp. SS-MA-C1-2]|uniref:GntR family transcriptional regulator n=1 Tax=Vibrio sp. SS-MA-C1-2 TaxID=2908646 RepID=UPI001F1B0941|nr:GntR family transcriptional regulator [Vibrio sp. SS-MA-C1-2]UJF17776.1 GntR family transcriptional regulator [Vibrio sp. SS-MA-C1-2]
MPNKLPLYLTIRNELEQRILHSVYQEKIEGELTLASEFGVARGTIKQAVDSLVRDGLLEKKQGKGTFINREQFDKKINDFPDSLSFMTASHPISCQIMSIIPTNANYEQAEKLNLHVGSPLFKVDRRYQQNEKIIGFLESYLDSNLFPDISTMHCNMSLYEQLRTFYGITAVEIKEDYQFLLPTEIERIILGISDLSEVIMKINRVSYNHSGKVVDYSNMLIKNNQLSVNLKLDALQQGENNNLIANIHF